MALGKGFINPYTESQDDGSIGSPRDASIGREYRGILDRITATSTFTEEDWFFFDIVSNKHSSVRDLRTLFSLSLPEVLNIKLLNDLLSSLDCAVALDQESAWAK